MKKIINKLFIVFVIVVLSFNTTYARDGYGVIGTIAEAVDGVVAIGNSIGSAIDTVSNAFNSVSLVAGFFIGGFVRVFNVVTGVAGALGRVASFLGGA
jgi:hypothetical protein